MEVETTATLQKSITMVIGKMKRNKVADILHLLAAHTMANGQKIMLREEAI